MAGGCRVQSVGVRKAKTKNVHGTPNGSAMKHDKEAHEKIRRQSRKGSAIEFAHAFAIARALD